MVNTTAFKDYSRKQLIAILDSVRGRKSLILDSSLSGPLSIIAEFSLLKEHGVDKVFLLQNHSLDPDSKSIIYLIRPKIQFLKLIAAQIKQHKSLNFFIFFVPVRSVVCDIFLEDQGVLGDVVLGEYHFDLVPLDQDVLSLEIEDSFKHLALDGDTSVIYNLAKSIMKIQTIYGIIPKIAGKGENAKLLSHILVRMRRELVANLDDPAAQSRVFPLNSEIESMVIIDRSIDLITPMCYQLTYEGLIDEQFGIKSSIHPFNVAFVDLDNSIIGGPTPPQNPSASQLKTRKVPLNSTDKLYQKLRGMNFAIVSGSLNQVAKKLADDYQGRHQAKTISQIKDFVGKLSDIQAEHSSLRLHVNLCEQVSKYTSEIDFNKILEIQQNLVAGLTNQAHLDYIEEMISRSFPLHLVIRLLCLYSLVNDGVKARQYDSFKKQIIQTYGFKHLLTLKALEKTNLLKCQDPVSLSSAISKSTYPSLRRSLRLIVDDVDEHDPSDVAYVYSGFAPISIRLVQIAVSKSVNGPGTTNTFGWKGWDDVLKLLPGPSIDETQKAIGDVESRNAVKTCLVVFIGGCTFTEIASLRFLGMQSLDKSPREYIVVTTNITNGSGLIKSLIQE